MQKEVIGRGTWIDKVAYRVIERERNLKRSLDLLRTESGIGASGIPHIGSMADVIRSHAVTLAMRDMGYDSEHISFADDMDGLRKVPEGLPSWLNDYLLVPVSMVPDPLGNCDSFGTRMSQLLTEALDSAGIEYVFKSGRRLYESGALADIIHDILLNAKIIGEKIYEITGQSKYLTTLPYFPICKGCNRIYVARATRYDPVSRRVSYVCEGVNIGKISYEGCGNVGEADISKADGKLAWKVEFAARWKLLDIRFEAYGKDIADSVKVNDWVAKHVLNYEPPYHIRYEMFLDRLGRKISKSRGNVFTPQMWYTYATPQSLILLMLKRSVGTRRISPGTIVMSMDEYDRLEEFYFKGTRTSDRAAAKLRGLYEYCNNLRPPQSPGVHVPYRLLVEMATSAHDDNKVEFITSRLRRYGYIIDDSVTQRINLAIRFAEDFGRPLPTKKVELREVEREAIVEVLNALRVARTPDEVQASIFGAARSRGIPPPQLFSKFYVLLIGKTSGPRLGPYLFDLGYEKVKEILSKTVSV
ncbi:MAG: lysine--tRNA ligase [Aigarchaeota archaeon]|nr:lysine--tRNA ligase [Aigarchaeota archaeon]MDW8092391.1 lysine--tRNA ligase [Nitrososphaerota archaeon]